MDEKKMQTLIPLFDELRGERVLIRPYRESDAAAMLEAHAESRDLLRPWMPFADLHHTVEEKRDSCIRWMAQWLLREQLVVGFWDKETQRYLGSSGLHPRDWTIGYFAIGYWVRASEAGKGYVTETVKLLTDYAFTHLQAQRIEIRCDERNQRSAAVARRLGFVQEGCLRNDSLDTSGQLRNTLIFALTPDDCKS